MILEIKDRNGVLLAWECSGCEAIIALSQHIPDHKDCVDES